MAKIRIVICVLYLPFISNALKAQNHPSRGQRPLSELQQSFVGLRFGMFIHLNILTYENADWPDPETPESVFNPTKLNCDQ
ncbi:hypothetical protein [Mucilaginibacter frigoritolerans]|nr:hypothetical protein [Mucilaginibacter frigoritolerans]